MSCISGWVSNRNVPFRIASRTIGPTTSGERTGYPFGLCSFTGGPENFMNFPMFDATGPGHRQVTPTPRGLR